MSSSISAREPVFQFPRSQTVERNTIDRRRYDALAAELQASLAREDVLRKEKHDLSQRHVMLAQEFEHRVTNGLQLIASLLSLQSRTMPTPEACHPIEHCGPSRCCSRNRPSSTTSSRSAGKCGIQANFSSACATTFRTCYSKTEPITPSWSKERRLRYRRRSPARSGLSQTS